MQFFKRETPDVKPFTLFAQNHSLTAANLCLSHSFNLPAEDIFSTAYCTFTAYFAPRVGGSLSNCTCKANPHTVPKMDGNVRVIRHSDSDASANKPDFSLKNIA
jgi:hypothetical protein